MAWVEFQAFTSSNIAAIRYDQELGVLEVSFHNGGTYEYYDVPAQVAADFDRAVSKGEFLAEHIKGAYRYSRI